MAFPPALRIDKCRSPAAAARFACARLAATAVVRGRPSCACRFTVNYVAGSSADSNAEAHFLQPAPVVSLRWRAGPPTTGGTSAVPQPMIAADSTGNATPQPMIAADSTGSVTPQPMIAADSTGSSVTPQPMFAADNTGSATPQRSS